MIELIYHIYIEKGFEIDPEYKMVWGLLWIQPTSILNIYLLSPSNLVSQPEFYSLFLILLFFPPEFFFFLLNVLLSSRMLSFLFLPPEWYSILFNLLNYLLTYQFPVIPVKPGKCPQPPQPVDWHPQPTQGTVWTYDWCRSSRWPHSSHQYSQQYERTGKSIKLYH